MIRFLRAFGQFWYDFVIGDDWKIAFAVTTAVVLAIALQATRALSDTGVALFGGIAVIVAFSISLIIDVRVHEG